MADPDTVAETAESIFDSMRDDRLVSIYIGDDPTPFLIQQSIICAASPFFKTAFTGSNTYEEAKTGILRLPEDDLQAWQIFIYWLVRAKIPQGFGLSVIKAWTLGDKYQIPQLQDDVMFEVMRILDDHEEQSIQVPNVAFSFCPPGSLMRKFLSDQVVLIAKHCPRALWDWNSLEALCEDPGNRRDLLHALFRNEQENLFGW
ncbi:hypothetical protein M409DRAFT_18526 [Zasmidium cellare ATCC 36951]|uniref:Uncharacterized protein n=1 Tax=Zasmidium cellare ATCC 36951 TaxID=1080233 RepID=A0A6A6CYZ1_ZASCE|nr:uncharacterized protein M409DRAFT_18526 [Zasmidium cellare ATCC 36951]KAF2171410.1 hypothetical protein M409DRAFT_18526 [Zasmidium cellare ATCC 36951]